MQEAQILMTIGLNLGEVGPLLTLNNWNVLKKNLKKVIILI